MANPNLLYFSTGARRGENSTRLWGERFPARRSAARSRNFCFAPCGHQNVWMQMIIHGDVWAKCTGDSHIMPLRIYFFWKILHRRAKPLTKHRWQFFRAVHLYIQLYAIYFVQMLSSLRSEITEHEKFQKYQNQKKVNWKYKRKGRSLHIVNIRTTPFIL